MAKAKRTAPRKVARKVARKTTRKPRGPAGVDANLLADQHAQTHVVAFGALTFLNRAIAHLDRCRDRAHRDRIGGIRACPPRRVNEAFGKVDERGLVEQ